VILPARGRFVALSMLGGFCFFFFCPAFMSLALLVWVVSKAFSLQNHLDRADPKAAELFTDKPDSPCASLLHWVDFLP